MVRDGDLGDVRMIEVEYVQGHNAALTRDRERRREQLAFRSGPGRRVADPRRHRQPRPPPGALRLLPGLVAADRRHHRRRPGPDAHDYAGILFRLENNAPGVMWVTQAGAGAVHGLHFRALRREGRPRMGPGDAEPALLFPPRRAGDDLRARRPRPEARGGARDPGRHRPSRRAIRRRSPFFTPMRRKRSSPASSARSPIRLALDFPTVEDGARTMQFIAAALESSHTGGWVDYQVAF